MVCALVCVSESARRARSSLQLADAEIAKLSQRIRRSGVSQSPSRLFSFVRPEHEQRLAGALASGIPLSISHQILPEYREYERTSTVVINAYLQPLMGSYLGRLTKQGPKSKVQSPTSKIQNSEFRLRVMQSSGGSISAEAAAAEPVRTILSGPSGGIVGALRAARAAGFQKIITFDMGGTSTDVALCDRDGLRMTNEAVVAGLPVAVSVMDIHTVGAGGGSIFESTKAGRCALAQSRPVRPGAGLMADRYCQQSPMRT